MAHEFRNVPVRKYAKDLVAKGRIGKVRELHYINYMNFASSSDTPKFNWLWDSKFDGGMLGAIGSHHVDLIRYILGEEFSEIQGSIFTRNASRQGINGDYQKVTADDGFSMIFSTESCVTGNLLVTTTLSHAPSSKFVIGGEKG